MRDGTDRMRSSLCDFLTDRKPFLLCESAQEPAGWHAIKIAPMEPLTDKQRRDEVAARIRAAREAAGYSNAELCRMLKITATRLTSWEKGRALPNSARLWQDLCEACDVTCDYILRGTTSGLSRAMYTKLMQPHSEQGTGFEPQ